MTKKMLSCNLKQLPTFTKIEKNGHFSICERKFHKFNKWKSAD